MKTNFKLQTQSFAVPVRTFNIEVASHQSQSVEIPGISIEGEIECSIQELRELWVLQKEVLSDAPKVIENLGIELISVLRNLEDKMNPTDENVEVESNDDLNIEETKEVPEETVLGTSEQ